MIDDFTASERRAWIETATHEAHEFGAVLALWTWLGTAVSAAGMAALVYLEASLSVVVIFGLCVALLTLAKLIRQTAIRLCRSQSYMEQFLAEFREASGAFERPDR